MNKSAYTLGEPTKKKIKKAKDNNQKWFNLYLEYLIKSSTSNTTITNYVSALSNFIVYLGEKEIQDVTLQDMDNYLKLKFESIRTRNNRVEYFRKFFVYLDKHSNTNIQINNFSSLIDKEKEMGTDKRTAKPLTIHEVIKIREILKNEEKYTMWLTFELIYNQGLKLNELASISKKNYNKQESILYIKGKAIQLNPLLQYLIADMDALPEISLGPNGYQYRITEIGTKIGRGLIWRDIISTREKHFFKCPSCDQLYENNPDLWAIYHYKIDNSKWMICRNCAEKGLIIHG